MAFYVIEKKEQLLSLPKFGDCFIDFILQNDNFHPILNFSPIYAPIYYYIIFKKLILPLLNTKNCL